MVPVTLDPFAPPPPLPRTGHGLPAGPWDPYAPRPEAGPSRWRHDVARALGVVVASVLLGAPAGLLWSAVAPRLQVTVTDKGLETADLEGSKAFIGADGSYLLVMLGVGLVCGLLAWFFARKGGPWTVAGLTVGGVLAALVAARVGLQPGAHRAIQALAPDSSFRGTVDFYLGARNAHGDLHLRAPWAALGWPVGALLAFLVPAGYRSSELD